MNVHFLIFDYFICFVFNVYARSVNDSSATFNKISSRQRTEFKHPCSSVRNPCFRRGICIPDESSYKCQCHTNLYKGDNCTEVVKHCSSSKCLNGGTCYEAQGTFYCACPTGHQGINCEIDKNGVERVTHPVLVYEVDIMITYIQKYVIALASLGTNLKILFSTGDGFSFTITDKHFIKTENAKEWLKSNKIPGKLPAEQRFLFRFNHIYTKIDSYTKLNMEIYNNDNPIMKTELPVVVFPYVKTCVPSISLHSCGDDVKSSPTYHRQMKITVTSQVQRGCINSTLDYKWNVFLLTPEFPVPPGIPQTFSSNIPGKIVFEPFKVDMGLYTLQLMVKETLFIGKEKDSNSHYNLAKCWFKIVPNPPVAIINGGSYQKKGWKQDNFIDASASYDPDLPPNMHLKSLMEFIWSCWNELPSGKQGKFCKGMNHPLSQTGSKLKVPAKSLLLDNTYIFSLDVKKNDLYSTITQRIHVVLEDPPALKLKCLKNCGPKALPTETVIYKVSCPSCVEANFKINYTWDITPRMDNQKQTFDWEKDTKFGKNSDCLLIFANHLFPGDEYVFTIIGKTESNIESQMELTLTMIPKPKVGNCSVDPSEGVSSRTTFKIICSGFGDSGDSTVLNYHYYQEYKSSDSENTLLLNYDTLPYAERLFLMPGLADNNYQTKVAVKVTDQFGSSVFHNISVVVKPLNVELRSEAILDEVDTIIKNPSHAFSRHDASGSMQVISVLTEIFAGVHEPNLLNKIEEMRTKMREIFVKTLTDLNVYDISTVKQSSSVLLKILSPWNGEKMSRGVNNVTEYGPISSLTIRNTGYLIKRFSEELDRGTVTLPGFQVAEISTDDAVHVANTLISIGEFIIRNQSDYLFRSDDNWEEEIEDVREDGVDFMPIVEKNEDYPNYRELEFTYQIRVKNFRQGFGWFLEGVEYIGHALEKNLLEEEDAIEIQTRNIFLWVKKDEALSLADRRLGISNQTSGIIISKALAKQLQDNISRAIGVEVGIITSNPIWWKKDSFINSDVIYVNIRNAETGKNIAVDDISFPESDGLNIYLKIQTVEQKDVKENGSGIFSSRFLKLPLNRSDDLIEDSLTVHRIDVPCGGALMLHFEPPDDARMKYLVVIKQNHRPSLEDFLEDSVVQFPHDNISKYKKSIILMKDRPYSLLIMSTSKVLDPEFPQLFYLAVMPQDNVNSTSKDFKYSFNVQTVLCQYWDFTKEEWSTRGCQVGPDSSYDNIHCKCTHLSLFGVSILVAPNKVDPFSDIKLFLKMGENPVSVAFISSILIIYLLMLLWARHKDLVDTRKNVVIFLDENKPSDTCMYLLTVYTGTGSGCGTTANVALRLEGTSGLSRIYLLSAFGHKILSSGSEDWFALTTPHPLGEILNIRLWHDSSGRKLSWYCDKVVVRELEKTEVVGVWVFLIHRWLTVGGLPKSKSTSTINPFGTLPCCKVRTATPKELIKWKIAFTNSARSNFCEKHLWLSVFKRPAQSPFTSCQRLSMAVCILLSTMLANIMFYGIPKGAPVDQLDEGETVISIREYIIAIEGSFITFFLNFPPMMLFRLSDPSEFSIMKVCSHKFISKIPKLRRNRTENGHETIKVSVGQKTKDIATDVKEIIDDSKITFEAISNPLDKRRFLLPNWCRLISWIWCVSAIIISSYMICLYGLSFGKFKALRWMSSVLIAFLQGIILVQPLKVLALSLKDSVVTKITDGKLADELMEAPPPEISNKKWVSYQNRGSILNTRPDTDKKLSFSFQEATGNVRQPLAQEKIQMLAIKERRWREWSASAIDVISLVFYIVALYVVTYIASDPLAWNSAHIFEEIISKGQHNQGEQGPNLDSIVTNQHLLDYLNLTVIPSLHAKVGYSGKPILKDQGWTADLPYKLLGAPRLRQIRVISGACAVPNEIVDIVKHNSCIPAYNYYTEDQANYSIGWEFPDGLADPEGKAQQPWQHRSFSETKATSFIGKLEVYPGNGYWTELGRNLGNSRRMLEYLWKSGWLDRCTRALMIEFSAYNVDCNLFSTVSILIERGPVGGFITSYQIQTSKLLARNNFENIRTITSYAIFIIATIILFYRQCRRFILSNKYKSIDNKATNLPSKTKIKTTSKWKRLAQILILPKERLKLEKETSKWTILKNFIRNPKSDLPKFKSNTDLKKKGLLSQYLVQASTIQLTKNISSTPAYPLYPLKHPSFIEWCLILLTFVILVLNVERYIEMHESLQRLEEGAASNERHKFFSMFDGLQWDAAFRYALAFDVALATIALWHILPNFRRLPAKALTRSAKGPLPGLVTLFFIIIVAFSSSAFCSSLFRTTYEFSSIKQSLLTLFLWSQRFAVNEDFVESTAVYGQVFFCLFSLTSFIYIINLFLAILIADFEATHRKQQIQKVLTSHHPEYGIIDFLREFIERITPNSVNKYVLNNGSYNTAKVSKNNEEHKWNKIFKTNVRNKANQKYIPEHTQDNSGKALASKGFRLRGGGPTINRRGNESSSKTSVGSDNTENTVILQKVRFDAMGQLARTWLKNSDHVNADLHSIMEKCESDGCSSSPQQKQEDMPEKMTAMMAVTISKAKEKERKSSLDDEECISLIRVLDDKGEQKAIESNKLLQIKGKVLQMYHNNQPTKTIEGKYDWEEIIGASDEERLTNLAQWKADELWNSATKMSNAGSKAEPNEGTDILKKKPNVLSTRDQRQKIHSQLEKMSIFKKELAECKRKVINTPQRERILAGIQKMKKEEYLEEKEKDVSFPLMDSSKDKKKHQFEITVNENEFKQNIRLKLGIRRLIIEEEYLKLIETCANTERICTRQSDNFMKKEKKSSGLIFNINLLESCHKKFKKLIKINNKSKFIISRNNNKKQAQLSTNGTKPHHERGRLTKNCRKRFHWVNVAKNNITHRFSYKDLNCNIYSRLYIYDRQMFS